MGKLLIIIGVLFLVAGIIIQILPSGGFPRLPGDIHIRGDNYTFYFPLRWNILLSLLATLAWWLFGK